MLQHFHNCCLCMPYCCHVLLTHLLAFKLQLFSCSGMRITCRRVRCVGVQVDNPKLSFHHGQPSPRQFSMLLNHPRESVWPCSPSPHESEAIAGRTSTLPCCAVLDRLSSSRESSVALEPNLRATRSCSASSGFSFSVKTCRRE